MIAIFFARYGLHLALLAGVVVTVATWDRNRISRAENRGATQERARVVTEEKKIDAKAEKARRAVAATPADGVLAPWERTK